MTLKKPRARSRTPSPQELLTNARILSVRKVANEALRAGDFGIGVAVGDAAELVTLNSAVTTGLYSYAFNDANSPSSSSGALLVSKYATIFIRQDAFVISNGDRFTRYSTDSGATWSAWQSLTIQSGSNANGDWIRWPDGTQECRRTLSTTKGISTAFQGGFVSTPNTATFAMPFSSSPIVSVEAMNGTAFGAQPITVSTLSATIRWQSVTSQASALREAYVVARGYWTA